MEVQRIFKTGTKDQIGYGSEDLLSLCVTGETFDVEMLENGILRLYIEMKWDGEFHEEPACKPE